jgi:hypothetical protein
MKTCSAHLAKQQGDARPRTCNRVASFTVAPIYPPTPRPRFACTHHLDVVARQIGGGSWRIQRIG